MTIELADIYIFIVLCLVTFLACRTSYNAWRNTRILVEIRDELSAKETESE
jgi:predicted ferric reductase